MTRTATGKSNKENPSRAFGNLPSGGKRSSKAILHFADSRPEAKDLRKLQNLKWLRCMSQNGVIYST